MNTNWHFYILCSVVSLSIASSAAYINESPSARRPFRRKTIFKLNNPTTASTIDSSFMLNTRSVVSSAQLEPEREQMSRADGPESHMLKTPSYFAALPDVSVTCSTSGFIVRVKRAFYGLGANAEELRLGSTCKSNGMLGPYGDLLFSFRLTDCDVQREVSPGYIVYKYVLHYSPSPKRSHQIECRFPRYHHVYQLAVRPTWQTTVVHKRLKGHPNEFQIQLMDDTWTMPAKSQTYMLGQTVNFQVSAAHLPSGGKLYLSSCSATPFNSSIPSLKYTLIDNFGCMLESQKDPGGSRFVSPWNGNALRFSLSAFQFTSVPDAQVQIQCEVHVTSEGPSPAHKSCSYSDYRWRALTGDDSICDCCESKCLTSKSRRAMLEGSAYSGPILVSDQPPTSEDSVPLVTFETNSNGPITVPQNPESLFDTSYLAEDKYDQQSYKDSEGNEEEDDNLEGEGRAWLKAVKAGWLDHHGLRAGLNTEEEEEEWELSGMEDLEEFGEVVGLGLGFPEGFPETEEKDGSGSMDLSETLEMLEGELGEREDLFSGESLWLHQLEKEEVASPLIEGPKEISASEKDGAKQRGEEWREKEEQHQDRGSDGEDVRGSDRGGEEEEKSKRDEEVEQTRSQVEWKYDEVSLGDGLVDDKEMTWRFTWR